MPDAKLVDIKDFFGMTMKEMRDEWSALSDQEKAQIREGIGNGSYTY